MKTPKLQDGKVYLRDIRNGRILQYEDSLSQMSYMERIVGGEDPQVIGKAGMHVSLNGLERAAEFDRRAALTPEQLKAEDKAKEIDIVGAKKEAPKKEDDKPAKAPPAPPAKK